VRAYSESAIKPRGAGLEAAEPVSLPDAPGDPKQDKKVELF